MSERMQDSVPSDVRELSLILEEVELQRREVDAVREVGEVRERDLVAREVPLLGQDRLVARELGLERLRELGHPRLVGLLAEHRREDPLVHDPRRERVEVRDLDRLGLVEERGLVRVARREERRLGFGGDVPRDGAGLEQDEAVVLLRSRVNFAVLEQEDKRHVRCTELGRTAGEQRARAPCARPS
jgi:hypothetical protein